MATETLLEIKNLVTEFRGEEETVKAINDISFSLSRGETIGIVGESGSGKSVTALSVMRLVAKSHGKTTSGEILYHSRNKGKIDITKLSGSEMRALRGNEIAMIFQEPMTSLNPVYTCGDQVMEAILLHQKVTKKEAKIRTIELFKEVQLPHPERIFDCYRKKDLLKNADTYLQETEQSFNSSFFETELSPVGHWTKSQAPQPWVADTDKIMTQGEFYRVFEFCVSKMPPKLVPVFLLKFVDEKNAEEICKELNISPSNYWVIIHRSRLLMRKCLETNWF